MNVFDVLVMVNDDLVLLRVRAIAALALLFLLFLVLLLRRVVVVRRIHGRHRLDLVAGRLDRVYGVRCLTRHLRMINRRRRLVIVQQDVPSRVQVALICDSFELLLPLFLQLFPLFLVLFIHVLD